MIKRILKNIKMNIQAIQYKGNDVHCPICGAEYKIFGKFGNTSRINAKCYKCKSLERHRLLWIYLQNKTNLLNNSSISNNSPKRLLHFAPELSFYQIFSNADFIDYYPCDISPQKYNYKGNVKIHTVDITQIQFEDNYFDAIICNHVLEHIIDDRLAMKELYRVLKPNGWAYLQVPIEEDRENTFEDFSIVSDADRERVFGQFDHVRIYGRDYKDRLESVGFKVIKDDYVNSFSDSEIFRYGLMKNEYIYIAKKIYK